VTGAKTVEAPPQIRSGMPVEEIVDASIKFGGQTVLDSAKVLKKNGLNEKAALAIQLRITDHYKDWDGPPLINAVKLYQLTAPKNPYEIFALLINSDAKLPKELALQLAAEFPSTAIARELDRRLTVAIEEDELYDFFVPQLAMAITRNRMFASYSILKLGLFQTNSEAFVAAMATLNPRKASEDFLEYLSQVPVEELRQLTLVTLDVYSCIGALRHIQSSPPAVTHPKFETLFLFAMSRNAAFAQVAREIIAGYLPQHSRFLARKFSQLPNWIQVAYIEGTREKMNATMSNFFQELRGMTAQREVLEEIDSVRM
jgi:hypothetical protein